MQASHAAVSSGADTFSYGGASFLRRITFPSTSRAAPSTVSFRSLSRPISVRASASGGAVEKEAPSDLTFYELLGVNETGSLVEIKQAYKQLARKYHPDLSPPDGVKENIQRFIKVQEAYETLSDPRKRAMYDLDLARGIHRAFSARRRFEDLGRCNWWRTQWQSQLSELKRRCARREGGEQMSWGAQMRRQRSESTMGC